MKTKIKMKTKIILAMSVLMNLALLRILVFHQEPLPAELSAMQPSSVTSNIVARPRRPASTPAVTATGAQIRFDWRTVESADYRQYINNLRTIGCPEQTIRDIIVADVEALFRERDRAQRNRTNQFEYWQAGFGLHRGLSTERVARRQELNREKAEVLRSLLGTEAPATAPAVWDQMVTEVMEQALDFLPAKKVAALRGLRDKFAAHVVQNARQRPPAQLAADYETGLRELLSPEEKIEFDLRLSETADRLRLALGTFQATEQEFRALFTLWQAFEAEGGHNPRTQSVTDAERDSHEAAKLVREERAQQVLGEARYREYQQAVGYR